MQLKLARLFLLTVIRETCWLYRRGAGLIGLGVVLYFLWAFKGTHTRSTPMAGIAVPYAETGRTGWCLANTLMLIFFKGWW